MPLIMQRIKMKDAFFPNPTTCNDKALPHGSKPFQNINPFLL